jgi:hypothetical protein
LTNTIGVYVLGGTPELMVVPTDLNGSFFQPTEIRLSVKGPDGAIYTVSGAELTLASGYYSLLYHPAAVGWYEYESWVKDGNGRERATTNGFEVTDRLY